MRPFYADSWLTVFHGDCRAVMAEMEPESVHCVVTSPPYWGLRDYGTATWEGGDAEHNHSERQARRNAQANPGSGSGAGGRTSLRDGVPPRECPCGATRIDAQLGLEPTPEEYVANLVAVFREVRRVLRKDGTVWLNLGDSYAASLGQRKVTDKAGAKQETKRGSTGSPSRFVESLKPKDLVGIPWRVAFALQADGWYLRSDIIWSKPNPMPESVTDRPTKSHEYLFLLAKSARYYFDADAVREAYNESSLGRYAYEFGHGPAAAIAKSPAVGDGNGHSATPNPAGRNIRSVWTVATAPYPGAHFATFPPKLIEPCIKAGTSERGVCPECGAPWERVTERTPIDYGMGAGDTTNHKAVAANGNASHRLRTATGHTLSKTTTDTTGWRPSCMCHSILLPDPIPAVVLDPFAGSGTTGMVAQSLSRRAVLIDLSLDYLGQLMGRNADIPLGLGA